MKWIFLAGFTPSRGSLYAPSRLRRRAIFNPTHTSVSGSAIILFSEWNLMITKTIKRIGMIPTIALARARGDGSFCAGSRRPPQGPQHPPDSVRRFKVSLRIVRLQGGMRSRHFSLVLAALAVFLGSRQRAAGRAAAGGAGTAGGIAVDVQTSGVRRARRGAGKGRSAGARARLSRSPPVQGRRRSQEKARSFSRSRRSRSRPRSNSARRNLPPPRRRSRTPISSCNALRSSSR